MLKKEFKRKDVERMRNLIKGSVNSSSETQIGYKKKQIEYKEGDIWVENKKKWTIKNGIKQTISKLDNIKKQIFMPLCCPKCGKVMKKRLDKHNYRIHKKCHDCVIKFEHKLKIHGKYKNYINNLQNRNKLSSLNEMEAYLLDAINNTSNTSFISEQGDIEDWRGGKVKNENVKEIKKAIKETRNIIKKNIKKTN
jgi:bacterioferritin-associated ferredoxin